MNNQNNNQNNNQIIGYDPQTGQPIYSTNNLINQNQTINSNQEVNSMNTQFNNTIATSNEQPLDKKELKKIKKEENKLINKASNAIGTTYFLLLGFLYCTGLFVLNPLGILNILMSIISYLWYIATPLIGALILNATTMKKVINKVNNNNYEKVKKAVLQQLIFLGVIYCAVSFNPILIIPIIGSFVASSIMILNELKKYR